MRCRLSSFIMSLLALSCAHPTAAFSQVPPAVLPMPGGNIAAANPVQILHSLIQAFQNCGPPYVYQVLSPQLFQSIFAQTGGLGCYAGLQQLGPVVGSQVVGQQPYPSGPIYTVKVQHSAGYRTVWLIGVSNFTQKVEALSFNFDNTQAPLDTPRPQPIPSPQPKPDPSPSPPPAPSDGCKLYPAMCVQ